MMRALLIALVLLLAGGAFADTGGSMGGGNWGGGGGTSSGGGGGYSGGGYSGGGGYSSSSSSGWSSSSSSTDWNTTSSSSSSDSGGSMSLGFMFFGLLMFGSFAVVMFKKDSSSSFMSARPAPDLPPPVDVSVLRVALDGRARRFVQTELKKIADIADTSTDWGRVTMLHQVAFLLRRLRDAWVYGGAVNFDMRQLQDAKFHFDIAVDEARARYREEVIRNADGVTMTRSASDYRPRSDEGEGLILVAIIMAARKELFHIENVADPEQLRLALDAASQLPQEHLVAVEIVWQPAEENDRLSSMELEVKYPYPEIAAFPHALVGKAFCTHCSGPFPAELVSCPHCGAPAPGREAA